MRRALMTLVLALAFPAAADAASVKVVDCVPALDPAVRSATFEARVHAIRRTERMQLRFTLQVREDGLWQRVVAPGFDSWLTSEPEVRRYAYTRTVTNLTAPAAYRMVVRFRWLDADGTAIRSTRVTSAACRQPDMRPDLQPQRVEVLPAADPDQRRYLVSLRNDGRTDALPFAATLAIGGEQLAPLAVLGLPAATRQVVAFTGPPCTAGSQLTVTLDPGAAVDERDEDDNVLVTPCPAPAR
jgi:CARDB